MKLIVCLDEREGMSFGGKRQSRDRVLLENIKGMLGDEKLYIKGYSEKLISSAQMNYSVCDSFFGIDGFCFAEAEDVKPYADMLEELVIYRWNRHYPSDLYFNLDPASLGFSLAKAEEFEGSSHEKITKEIYTK